MTPVMTAEELNEFMREVFQQVADDFNVDHVGEGEVTMRLLTQEKHLRPGGTVSGPSMFGLADVAAYVVTLSQIGPKALAVTTNCSIDFMRKPVANVPLIAKARLLKLGKQLSVTDVLLYSEGMDAPVARASLTYAIPPRSMG
ncbi:hotdog fold thioesterase [Sulfitobacter sp. JBTF-M27]|uniref:Hotdog fold thioesterase n=1 Tax=Sulfitobacter sediminilitoris TaxID=2698830 RepID=A0A6P0C7N7_9RHOB|nr:PaaI family thioesterase [Sulfitobacter sediminilitoris]NEK22201.1 hotdog fold thioesterase [Sulfitobacter sediminilitoris]